jgi:TolA-binding protein
MKRLIDEGASPFETSLISALRDERPSSDLVARMQEGLGIAAASGGAAATAGAFGWAKLAVVGLVAAGLAGVGISELRSASAPAAAPPTVKPVPAKVEAPQPATPAPVAVSELAVQNEPAPARPRPAPSGAADLKEEIRLLDQARAAVRAGESNEALAVLAKYNRRYPRGQFRQEAQVLRVEALEQAGNKKAAVELGKKFVAAHPESPHVERVERVTGSEH